MMRPRWRGDLDSVIHTPDDERSPDEIRELMAEIKREEAVRKRNATKLYFERRRARARGENVDQEPSSGS